MTSSTAIAIQAENLSKCYRIYNHPRDRLVQTLWGRDRHGRRKQWYREFWALQELSFSLQKGQTLGVMGRNGSGKSTLLQLLCGTLQPTTGEVHVHGRVGALLELGSGFNPEFSGLENVFLNASLLGLSRAETEQRLDQILGFADIGDFIHQPVKTYSSGMGVRLAFAVQAHIDPDVLVVDEALAVGDELFQKKCYDHLSRLKERGTAVLLVTHSCPQIIQHCDQALLLHKGRARMLAQAARVTVTYQRLINASDAEWDENFPKANQSLQTDSNAASYQETTQFCSHETAVQQELSAQHEPWLDTSLIPQTTDIYPSKGVRIDDVWIETTSGIRVNTLPFGQEFIVIFSYKSTDDLEKIGMACHLASHTGLRISGQSVPEAIGAHQGGHIAQIPAETSWQVRYAFHGGLWPGIYFIGGGVVSCAGGGENFLHRVVDFRALRILDSRPISVIGASSLQASQPQIHGLVTDAQLKRPVPWPAPAET